MNRKEVDIPVDLRAALLGEEIVQHVGSDVEQGTKPTSLLSSLLSSRASEIAAMDEDELVKEIRSINEKLWGRNPRQYECRVVNGSYTVIKNVEKDLKFRRLGSMVQEEEEEAGPQRATQKIETVFSASICYKAYVKLARLLCSGSEPIQKESKVIADGINLSLKPGKMYLVLGLPGSGKSTLLKMIANTLPQDKTHVIGGDVSVNGMSASDKDVVWTVSVFSRQISRRVRSSRIDAW